MEILEQLQRDFNRSSTWTELGLLLACLALAYLACRAVGRGRSPLSIWLGQRTWDGLLFPLVALALVLVARAAWAQFQPVFVLRLAVPLLVSLALIRFLARVLGAVFPHSGPLRVVERTVAWLAWVGAVLWILGLLPLVLDQLDAITLPLGKTRLSLLALMEGLISTGLVIVGTLWLSATFERRVLDNAVSDLSMRKVAVNATRALLLLVGMLFTLSAVGVDLTALSVLGGALGVGLGFGLQKLASNYISGFVILLERSLRIGDNVKVDGFEGRITDIKTRYTLIRALNGRESIVPNESLITQRVENLSEVDRKFNVTTSIVLDCSCDVAQAQRILVAAAAAQPRVLTSPGPAAFLLNFVPDGLELSLSFWIIDPEAGTLALRSDINMAMLQALRAAGIGIASPQRTVQLQGALALSRQPCASASRAADMAGARGRAALDRPAL